MSYDSLSRKGDHRERKARVEQLVEQVAQRVADAEQASARADRINTSKAHADAASAWRRIIYPATRLDLDATIYRDAVRRHMYAAEIAPRGKSAQ